MGDIENLNVEIFTNAVKKLLSKVSKSDIPFVSEELIRMAIAAREGITNDYLTLIILH